MGFFLLRFVFLPHKSSRNVWSKTKRSRHNNDGEDGATKQTTFFTSTQFIKLVLSLSQACSRASATLIYDADSHGSDERAKDKHNNRSSCWTFSYLCDCKCSKNKSLPLRYVSRFWIWHSIHRIWASMPSLESSERKAMQFFRFCFQYKPYANSFVLDLTCWVKWDGTMRIRKTKNVNNYFSGFACDDAVTAWKAT